jgi:hypothetical protein
MGASHRIDELGVDTQGTIGGAQAAFQQIAHVQRAADLGGADWLALIDIGAGAGDHHAAGNVGQVRGQIIGNGVGQIGAPRAVAEIAERHHHQRQARRREAGGGRWIETQCHRDTYSDHHQRAQNVEEAPACRRGLVCGGLRGQGRVSVGRRLEHHGQAEMVAAPGHRDDAAVARASLQQRLAQGGDRPAEIAFLDRAALPDGLFQLVPAHQAAMVPHQIEQGVEQPAGEADRRAVP